MPKIDLQLVKERLRIQDLYVKYGFPMPRRWNSHSNPTREDRKPSFSVNTDGTRWKDFATGDGGDVIDFISYVQGVSVKEAIQLAGEMCGGVMEDLSTHVVRRAPERPPEDPRELVYPRKFFKSGGKPETSSLAKLARLRRLDLRAMWLAQEFSEALGYSRLCGLRFGIVRRKMCYMVVDDFRKGLGLGEARRLDGEWFDPIHEGDAAYKCHSLKGSHTSLPLGTGLLRDEIDYVMLVEGSTDWLAAWHFIERARRRAGRLTALPVALLGGGNYIHKEGLAELGRVKRHVRIYKHDDSAGAEAVQRWGDQLVGVGCSVDVFSFKGLTRVDGKPVGDLNDAVLTKTEDREGLRGLLPIK